MTPADPTLGDLAAARVAIRRTLPEPLLLPTHVARHAAAICVLRRNAKRGPVRVVECTEFHVIDEK